MEIVFEDNHFLIINKKPGQLSQSDKTGDQSILELCKNYIKLKYSKKGNVFLGLVNRIDRPTSGLLILAKTSKCLERMNKILRNREIKKTYLAITEKHPIKKSDRLINFLKKNEKKNKSFVVNKEKKGSKESILNYKLVKELDNYNVLKIKLETGRHHQIRAQLSSIGYPIKGDLKYGAPRSNKNKSIHLHCRSIEISHPVNKKIYKWIAPTPKDALWSASPSD